jgi:thiamine kinase-like enzyme
MLDAPQISESADHKQAATVEDRIRSLPIWSGNIEIAPLNGGITNRNYLVSDGVWRSVVRFGDDIPIHGIMRFNELSAAQAAHAAGISPKLIFAAPGVMVTQCLLGRSLTPEDVRQEHNLSRIVELISRCHRAVPAHIRGPVLAFWVFQVIRSYIGSLQGEDCRIAGQLASLQEQANELEALVGPVTIVFGHNDLLAANIFDDGDRLWLLDWDYAGLNSPLFDLANLASNNAFSEADEAALLGAYFGREPDALLIRSFEAMKCASLMREALWSAVSENHSTIPFDYAAYTDDYLARLSRELSRIKG